MIANISTGIHTASDISNNNSNDAQPTTPTTESLLSSLSEKDRVIYERNNIRLRQMEAEVRQLATYGGACDELLEWLSDVRAYNPYNEKALLGCINAIFEKASEYGPWSGLEILKEANQKCGNGLSEKGRACIKKCYEDLHNSVTGRRPSNASIVSTASASHPSPASLTSNRSVSHVNIPESPTANNSFSQLVKLFDSSVFPQSPNSNMGSPMSSPQFRGTDVNASQIAPNQAVANNTAINDSHLNAYLQQRMAQAAQSKQTVQQHHQQQIQQQLQYQLQQSQQQGQQQSQSHHQQQQFQQQYQYQYQYQPQQPQHIPQQMTQQRLNQAQIQQVQQMYNDQMRRAQYDEQQRRAQEEQRKAQEEEQRKVEAEQKKIAQQKLLQQQQKQKEELQQRQALARHYLQVFGQPFLPHANDIIPHSVSMPSVAAHLQSSTSMAAANRVSSTAQPQQQAALVNNYHASTTNTTASTAAPVASVLANTPAQLTASAVLTANAIVPAVTPPASIPAATTTSAATPTMPSNSHHVRPNPLPVSSSVVTSQPSAVPTTPTTPTTPNTPVRAATINTSASNYALPSLPAMDISKIHLPGGGNVHKSAVPVVIPAATTTSTRPSGQGDKISYLFKFKHAFQPFRLAHGDMITRKPFYIGKEEYSRLFRNQNTTLKDYRGEPPLSFFITAWYEGTLERKCDWPTGARIELNGQQLSLQRREKVVNPNGGPSTITGKDKPFDMTRLLALDKNTIVIHQPKCACGTKKSYLFAVQVYKRFSENYILNSVKNTVISIATSERVIDDLLGKFQAENGDDDLIVVQNSVKMTLKCPLTFKKIKQPVRGVKCKHVDCFDLDAYLMVNKNENPTWLCPHCNREVGPTELARDLLVENLLETLPKRASEIEYTRDHTNYVITRMEDPDSDDDEDDDDEGRDGADASYVSDARAKHEPLVAKTAKNDNVIDLISDDEDEDDQGTTNQASSAAKKNSNIPSKRAWEA